MELHIEDELRVEGALHSNGEQGLDSQAGGGAGGAILIFVNHLDGEGTIEAKGGESDFWKKMRLNDCIAANFCYFMF